MVFLQIIEIYGLIIVNLFFFGLLAGENTHKVTVNGYDHFDKFSNNKHL